MGVDLTLLPLDCDRHELVFSHTLLPVRRDRDRWEAIQALPTTPLLAGLSCYVAADDEGESHYGTATLDAYDDPIQCVTAGQLAELNHNEPAWAYIRALPPETRVALYWN